MTNRTGCAASSKLTAPEDVAILAFRPPMRRAYLKDPTERVAGLKPGPRARARRGPFDLTKNALQEALCSPSTMSSEKNRS